MTVEFKKRDYSLTSPANARAVAVGLANKDWSKPIYRVSASLRFWRRQPLARMRPRHRFQGAVDNDAVDQFACFLMMHNPVVWRRSHSPVPPASRSQALRTPHAFAHRSPRAGSRMKEAEYRRRKRARGKRFVSYGLVRQLQKEP
jgi:hypothetical protein